MIKTQHWSPLNNGCVCKIAQTYDTANPGVWTDLKVVTKCPIHESVADEDLYQALLDECKTLMTPLRHAYTIATARYALSPAEKISLVMLARARGEDLNLEDLRATILNPVKSATVALDAVDRKKSVLTLTGYTLTERDEIKTKIEADIGVGKVTFVLK